MQKSIKQLKALSKTSVLSQLDNKIRPLATARLVLGKPIEVSSIVITWRDLRMFTSPHSVIRALGVTLPAFTIIKWEPVPHGNLTLARERLTRKFFSVAGLSSLMSPVTRRKIDFRSSTARDFLKRWIRKASWITPSCHNPCDYIGFRESLTQMAPRYCNYLSHSLTKIYRLSQNCRH